MEQGQEPHSIYTQELRQLVKIRRRGMYIYALPNLFTSANLILGYLSIIFTVEQNYIKAAWAILLASIFDLLDGRVARLTNTTSKFGVEYDSLSDLVSFGIAPSLLIYFAALQAFGRPGIVAALVYATCGALRLARFNVLAAVLPKSYFQGLPIPMASMAICTSIFFSHEIDYPLQRNVAYLVLTICLGLLMVSTFKFPSFKDFHIRQRRNFSALAFTFVAFIALISWFEVTAFLLIIAYILIAVLSDLWRSRHRWKKS